MYINIDCKHLVDNMLFLCVGLAITTVSNQSDRNVEVVSLVIWVLTTNHKHAPCSILEFSEKSFDDGRGNLQTFPLGPREQMVDLTVIVPALNEEARIEKTLEDVSLSYRPYKLTTDFSFLETTAVDVRNSSCKQQ